MKSAWARKTFLLKLLAIFVTGFVLAACSGGESGTGVQPDQDTVVGPINGFGSVIVNGIKFDTSKTSINIDGTPVNENNLSVGMVVKVTGEVNGTTGTATSISMEYEVRGLVLSNNINTNGEGDLSVMGQRIIIGADVQFESDVPSITSLELMDPGTVVKVSGHSDGQSGVFATYVKVISADGFSDDVKVKGTIANLTTNSFNIGSLLITYGNETELEKIPNNTLEDGMFVTVESDSASFDGNPLSFHAEEISLVTFDEHDGSEVEIEGVVTDDTKLANNEFGLSGRTIRFNNETTYEGGGPDDIANDLKLEVEGVVQADGSVLAEEIEFRNDSSIELSGRVTVKGTNSITVLGQQVFVNEITSYEDDTPAEKWDFNFGDIVIDDYVSVKLYIDPDDGVSLIANSIRKDENQGEMASVVEANVESVNGGTMKLIGMPSLIVDIGNNGLLFTGELGSEVEIRGNYNDINTTLVATELDGD